VELEELITALESRITDPKQGLPDAVFDLVTRLTPMVNVDLLLKDSENRTLLTWREDRFYGLVWHIPGGIIRFKETAAQRINKVAETELGTTVEFNESPLAITEMMNQRRDTRGHFFSLLHECRLTGSLAPHLPYVSGKPRHDPWAWHNTCPQDLIAPQRLFLKSIEVTAS